MFLEEEIKTELQKQGADFVHFVDISNLPEKQNKQYPSAKLLGVKLSAEYISDLCNIQEFLQKQYPFSD